MSEKRPLLNYALLGLLIVCLVISAISLVMVARISVPEDVATRGDIAGLKGDVSGLKGDVSGLKSDIDELRELIGPPAPPPGKVLVEGIKVPWTEVRKPAPIEVTFRNPGAETGTGEFPLTIAGEVVEVLKPVVDPYSMATLVVSVTKDKKGNYPVSINGLKDFLIVMGVPPDRYESAAVSHAKTAAPRSVLTEDEVIKEFLWYSHAAEPYRGTTIRTIIEALPYAIAEMEGAVPIFTDITGITVDMRIAGSLETTMEIAKELETGAGAYDFISVDTDANPMLGRRGGIYKVGELMKKYPELANPWFDFPDFMRGTLVSDLYTGELTGIPQSTGIGGFCYRRDWVTDPEEKAGFKAKYGYELVDPVELDRSEWTWDRWKDYMEWFTRPEEDMWGITLWGKTEPELTWEFFERSAHCGGAISQFVEWPEVELGPERDRISWERGYTLWIHRPYSYPLPIGYVGTEPVGALVEHGGNVNGPEMQYIFEFYCHAFHNYAAPVAWEIMPPESEITEFSTGKYFCTGPSWAGLFSGAYWGTSIEGVWWTAPSPVSKYWREGMPSEHDDLSQWSITGGTKNPEATYLYIQFAMGKPIELIKVLDYGINPMRCSTWEALKRLPDFEEQNIRFGGQLSLALTPYHWEQTCTDPAFFDRPGYMDACYPYLAEGLRSRWSGEKTMTEIAKALEELLEELGILRPDLRHEVVREPWREE